ncbi:MAG: hypothetical protein HRF42_04770 [Candidatus Brocadia sp.]|jgi:hypothetical protein
MLKSVRQKRQLAGQGGLIENSLRNICQMIINALQLPTLINNMMKESFSLSAKCDPCFQEDQEIWMIPKHPTHSQSLTTDENGLPVPPEGMLWGGKYEHQVSVYLEAGKEIPKQ